MSAPVPALPQRPADVAGDATLVELADAYARRVLVLAAARAGAQAVPADQLGAHALAALAIGRTITDDLHSERPGIVRDALAHGAGPDQVAAAQGTDTAGAPAPLDREPRSVRPPFDVRDDRFDSMRTTDPEGWRRAVHLDRQAALLEPLAGLYLTEREHAVVTWIAGWDVATIAPIVRLLWAARAAEPVPGETDPQPARQPVLAHQRGGRVHALADNVRTECGARVRNMHSEADGRTVGCPTCMAGLAEVTCTRCRARLAGGAQ